MGRNPCCSKEGLKRGAWDAQEDKILTDYIKAHGEGRWRNLPKKAGLKRCGKSCRLRWLNYLRPDIKRGNISPDEEELIVRLHKLLGNRWSLIAGRLPGRTDNEIKNYWNTNLVKKVQEHQSLASHHNATRDDANGSQEKVAEKVDPGVATDEKDSNDVVHTKAKINGSSKVVPEPPPQKTQILIDKPVQPSALSSGFSLNKNSDDFLMDFSVGEICSPHLLDSEFSDFCEFSYGNESSNDLSVSSQMLFSQGLVSQDDCNATNCAQPFVDSNLSPFTSPSDYGGEWLL